MGSGCETVAGDGRRTGRRTARRWASSRCGCTGRSTSRHSCRAAGHASSRSPCSTAPRSRAPPASRSIWTCVTALHEAAQPADGLGRSARRRRALRPSSKEFTPAMVKAVFDELAKAQPKNHFTVGILDDVTHTSLAYDPTFAIEPDDVVRAVFCGLGSDGTVGREQELDQDHRRGDGQLRAGLLRLRLEEVRRDRRSRTCASARGRSARPYLITQANFVACHSSASSTATTCSKTPTPGATFLLNAPYGPDEVWDSLPRDVQKQIIEKKLKLYVIDALRGRARTPAWAGASTRSCRPASSRSRGVLPRDEAIAQIKNAIEKTYGKRGEAVVGELAAVDDALAHSTRCKVPATASPALRRGPAGVRRARRSSSRTSPRRSSPAKGDSAAGQRVPGGRHVSQRAPTQWEKRNIALEIPVWEPDVCIQCGKCVLVCPHAVIRGKVYAPALLAGAPDGPSSPSRPAGANCRTCTTRSRCRRTTAPAAAVRRGLPRQGQEQRRPQGDQHARRSRRCASRARRTGTSSSSLPETHGRAGESLGLHTKVKDVQLPQPLFEFSGACAGCGETPYLKLMTQLFGDRAARGERHRVLVDLRRQPADDAVDARTREGRGPAWTNSLFEDNAEFGLGMRIAIDEQASSAREPLRELRDVVGAELADAILGADQSDEAGIAAQRHRVAELKARAAPARRRPGGASEPARGSSADTLVRRSVWIVGGDGWAYDIGFGGLDHVLASGRNVKLLVLDTEVYSNTGGQTSKATPLRRGREVRGRRQADRQEGPRCRSRCRTVTSTSRRSRWARATSRRCARSLEAESYDGPALIIAYSHCIAHGIDMAIGIDAAEARRGERSLAARTVSTRDWPRRARIRCSSIRRRRAFR